MFQHTFAFHPGTWVLTPWGDIGVVLCCAVNRGNIEQYLIQLKDRDDWFDGRDLKTAPSNIIPEPGPLPGPDWPTFPGGPMATAPEEPPNEEVREDEPSPPDSE